jgi:3-hydroxyacyl-[acyl-carrier-protein] dehydratase
MNFYLIDKVKEIKVGESASGIKSWSLDNQIFDSHFPGFPTVPGVLLTESMAQLSGVLIEQSYNKDYKKKGNIFPILSIIQKAKFRSFVEPGDQCIIETSLISIDVTRATTKTITKVGDKIVCEATLSFVIGGEKDIKKNPFLKKRQLYYHNILPESFK